MLFKYTPPGADPQVWPFTFDKLMASEAEAIEKVTHLTYAEFTMSLISGSMAARRALLWVLLKRKEPTLRYQQVDFPTGAVELEFEQEELKRIRVETEANADMTDEERDEALKQLDLLILDQMESGEELAPKEPSSTGDSPD